MNEDFELNQLWYPTNDELQDWGVQFLQLPVADYVGLPSWNQVQEGLTFINGICGKNATVSPVSDLEMPTAPLSSLAELW